MMASGLAWLALALSAFAIAMPQLCSAAVMWSVPSPTGLGAVLLMVSPVELMQGWAAMVVAMMLPTLGGTLVHVSARSLGRLRPGLVALVVAGYLAVWMVVGTVLLGLCLALRLAAPGETQALVVVLVLAAVWQVSPWKQAALNRCHRRPSLRAFGRSALSDALRAGLRSGAWCAQSCWALMLASLVVPAGHFPTMVVVAAFIWIERLEPPRAPAWRVRVPCRFVRILVQRLDLRPRARDPHRHDSTDPSA